MSLIERPRHWADPVIAVSEETTFLVPARGEVRLESGIRHAVQQNDYDRMMLGLACTQCCTPFPYPPGMANMTEWKALTSTEFRWPPPSREHGLELIAQSCCPICGFEVSPVAFELHDEGKLDDHAQWDAEMEAFQHRAEAWLFDTTGKMTKDLVIDRPYDPKG